MGYRFIYCLLVVILALLAGCSDGQPSISSSTPEEFSRGEKIVKANCKVCHAQGINGAPIIGNTKMWEPRLNKSIEELAANAAAGFGLMPAKGGNDSLSDDEITAAVEFMVSKIK